MSAAKKSQLTRMSEQMQMLLFVFSLAMMMFAFVLYKIYVK